jgi:hypothetical protein
MVPFKNDYFIVLTEKQFMIIVITGLSKTCVIYSDLLNYNMVIVRLKIFIVISVSLHCSIFYNDNSVV